jgi:predicted molibdopterin-dependent oxidoreductase YjgC
MSLGTISEKRNTTTTTATTTTTPPKVETPVLKVVEDKPPLKEPILVVKEPQTPTAAPKPVKGNDTKCMYCGAEKVIALALRGSIVLVMLALCFNLIKTAK